jgi:hypothetical protein
MLATQDLVLPDGTPVLWTVFGAEPRQLLRPPPAFGPSECNNLRAHSTDMQGHAQGTIETQH